MIEDRVEDESHIAALEFGDEFLQRGLAAELWVNREEVGRVVLVIGQRNEDGREVQTSYAEVLNVIEMVSDAGEVAAEEILPARRNPRHLVPPATAVIAGLILR